jgi:hypothetical protein
MVLTNIIDKRIYVTKNNTFFFTFRITRSYFIKGTVRLANAYWDPIQLGINELYLFSRDCPFKLQSPDHLLGC